MTLRDMIEWIIGIVIAIIIGYFVGKWINDKTKFGDKKDALDSKWKEKIANLEKNYELKIQKANSDIKSTKEQNKTELAKLSTEYEVKIGKINANLESIKEQNKTDIEKLGKKLELKYVEDMGNLKKQFKESEKKIKTKSVSGSRRSLVGKFIERFIPFLKDIPYEASDMHFMGQPIDYIVFEGLHRDNIEKVTFLEVKTGESKLTKREKSLKDAIQKKKVSWKEIRVDTPDEGNPDKEIENEDTSISHLYDTIDSKISSINSLNNKEGSWECEKCGKTFDTKANVVRHELICKL